MTNPDDINFDTNPDGKDLIAETPKVDLSQLSTAEKRKMLWKNKSSPPARKDELCKKLYIDKVLARKPSTRDILVVKGERVYRGSAMSIKVPKAVTDELGENV